MMDEEPNMPSTRYPPNTIYIIRARVRAREISHYSNTMPNATHLFHLQKHKPSLTIFICLDSCNKRVTDSMTMKQVLTFAPINRCVEVNCTETRLSVTNRLPKQLKRPFP